MFFFIDFACAFEGYKVSEMTKKHKKYIDYSHSRGRAIKSLSDMLRGFRSGKLQKAQTEGDDKSSNENWE